METSNNDINTGCSAALSPDSFFFMSPYRCFTTSGCFQRFSSSAVDGSDMHGVFQQRLNDAFLQARAAGIAEPRVVGAIPFDTRQPSALFIPESCTPFARHDVQQAASHAPASLALNIIERKEIPAQQRFESMVASAAGLTATPQVDKVVLSRLIDITTDQAPDSRQLLSRLIAQNPGSFNFHVPLPDGGVLLGASPELLLRKQGHRFSSLPLAGSARRQRDAAQDQQAGDSLMASQKDRHEHQLVIQAMRRLLVPCSAQLHVPDSPQLITTPTLWHLATLIEGTTRAGHNALALACLLHPTPALSGFPHKMAKQLIEKLEPFDRQLFGGIVGWCDDQGNGEWVVTIRCARLQQNQVRLFAGAGIVPASSPQSEWRETGVKLATMLNVFGLH
ncbi:isochorismate synthase EntC [Erwinia sp. OLTSP20]|uniref:isochorismate synthase EntC n=1 Tax=unclassified Erwinia TaxID=2622719 RepID=UPI000C68207F|nr:MULTISPECIES: isochorismate synthase EntC [unclassified Erwinia]PIJ50209.1 isochorismate synthase EntC [Erwinia sp. OAMSP11]PIJ72046.1 isochorismate synthase EntC [Erwinia sp. OLSSP12]PIJ81337.1 isochorismate synthase EntC [Erwinia sp. OLCASP19]PIJ84043.1 isochorismate synthase EntC [Erwinia sp. OLMTSP26]PIJ85742.1 isochorismate synthase EntC [Erwinia sp. OLMDSP33]